MIMNQIKERHYNMDNSVKREKIAEGVHFNSVTDPRYKFNKITVAFFTPLCEDKASLYALLPRCLHKANALFPQSRDFNNYLASLYNAKSDFDIGVFGDTQLLGISMNSMDDSYALHGEKITDAAAKTIFDCVFRPALESGVFVSAEVENGKRQQIESIEAEINEKRHYAANQAKRIIFKGEPAAVNAHGSVEKTREITPGALYEAYKELLKSAVIEIVCVGCNGFDDALRIAKDQFSALERADIVASESAYSPLKPEVAVKTELLPALNQSKMVLGFKTGTHIIRPVLALMSNLYGGTISSKLFLNVREKLSLCYYCWSGINKQKGVMLVSCGVEEANIEKAKAEILSQLDSVRNGDFTDDELNWALLAEQNNIKTVNDSLSSLTWWYIERIYMQEIESPEEYLKNYENIARENITEAAKSMKLDTFYVLSGEASGSESEGTQ